MLWVRHLQRSVCPWVYIRREGSNSTKYPTLQVLVRGTITPYARRYGAPCRTKKRWVWFCICKRHLVRCAPRPASARELHNKATGNGKNTQKTQNKLRRPSSARTLMSISFRLAPVAPAWTNSPRVSKPTAWAPRTSSSSLPWLSCSWLESRRRLFSFSSKSSSPREERSLRESRTETLTRNTIHTPARPPDALKPSRKRTSI